MLLQNKLRYQEITDLQATKVSDRDAIHLTGSIMDSGESVQRIKMTKSGDTISVEIFVGLVNRWYPSGDLSFDVETQKDVRHITLSGQQVWNRH
jgi:hypothetical protein